jgi:hypothetical protein
LEKLKTRLPKRAFKFFSDPYFRSHDYIVKINIINNGKIRFYPKKIGDKLKFRNKPNGAIDIEFITLCPSGYFSFLKYQDIDKYLVEYPTDKPLRFEGEIGHGSWYEDELIYLGNNTFSHEILMHSGAIIRINFKKFSFKRIKISEANMKNASWQQVLERVRRTGVGASLLRN